MRANDTSSTETFRTNASGIVDDAWLYGNHAVRKQTFMILFKIY